MDELFKLILDRIKTCVTWADADLGQAYFEKPPLAYPAALISINVPQWDSTKFPAEQTGNAEVIVRFVFNPLGSLAGGAPEPVKNKALEHFTILKQAHVALIGTMGDNSRLLSRISTMGEVLENGLWVYTVRYKAQIVEKW